MVEDRRGLLLYASAVMTSLFPLSLFATGSLLLVLQRIWGRKKYLGISLASTLVMATFLPLRVWIGFAIVNIMVFIYSEARKLDCSDFISGSLAILNVIGLICLFLGVWATINEIDVVSMVKADLEEALPTLREFIGIQDVGVDELLSQIPSAGVWALVLNLWLAILGERYLLKKGWLGEQVVKEVENDRMAWNFRLPDSLIWVFLLSVLLSFIDIGQELVQQISLNIFNVVMMAYIVQGAAVIGVFFEHNRIHGIWKFFWILIILQLYFVVSVIGFADYWIDFRTKYFAVKKEVGNE
ncbi:MAG: DUF2232 domain-containing protein [Bdellovibrionales bacterium]